jgi:hypothetical protein
MQRNLRFHRKGTADILSEKYDAAAAVPEMPLEKSRDGRKRADQI